MTKKPPMFFTGVICGMLISIIIIIFSGCSTTSVYIPTGQAVQLRETVKNTKVWVKTKKGLEPAVMDIPEGWYCLPDSENK